MRLFVALADGRGKRAETHSVRELMKSLAGAVDRSVDSNFGAKPVSRTDLEWQRYTYIDPQVCTPWSCALCSAIFRDGGGQAFA